MSNLNVAHTNDEVSTQLNLPTALGLVRPRRERTDADREWCSRQLAIPHEKRIDKLVFERMAFYGSLNPERTAYPSVKRLAREAMCSPRSAQYALRRLESAGLIECLDDASGRTSSRGGRTTSRYCVAGVQTVHPSGANRAPKVLKEGNSVSKDPSLTTDTVKSIDPALLEKVEKQIGIDCLSFPSPPSADGEYQHPKQVGMLCAVARKLGREVSEHEQRAFDKLSHERKILTLKPLLEAEQSLAAEGVVTPPPKAAPSPRHEIAHHHEGKSTSTRPACTEHRWTPPASDGISNCFDCDHEEKRE